MEENLFIDNAGLVILCPFLSRYFTELNMLENRQFRSQEAANRAVLLLQYLVADQVEAPEHLLVFNKVLCGVSIDAPVPLSIELTDHESELSQVLLKSVLQNWEMMKNSSVDNLRGSFLLREGRLVEEETSWTLTVESRAYDVVLDHLPWTISMAYLPWMNKRINTIWPAKV